MKAKNRTQQTGQAGQHYVVAAEICRRGAWAATLAGNVSGVDLYAGSADHRKQIAIQVKTRTAGTWQVSATAGRPGTEADADNTFWVFVDLTEDQPAYYVIPGWWIRNNIWEVYNAYLSGRYRDRHGDEPRKSSHHSILAERIAEWKGCWNLLGIFEEAGQDSEHT